MIYSNLKTKAFQRFGLILLGLGAYSSVLYFFVCDETSRSVYLPLLILTSGALVAYELKMRITTKHITLDRRGELLMLIYYKWLGFSTKSIQVPITNVLGVKSYAKWLRIPSYGYKIGNKTKYGLIDT